jgi:hypothetical protein
MPLFPDIDAVENYVNTNIIANGVEYITGPINNVALNGCIEFIRKSPLNWAKALLKNTGGSIVLSDEYVGVVVFSTISPTDLTFGDNIYNEYVFINMTSSAIPLITPSFYYNLSGQAIDNIPANTAINLFKVSNDLWVQGNNTGSGGGSTQKQPLTYVVGITSGSPTVGTTTWTLPSFLNSWVLLFVNRVVADQLDTGDGSPFITKALSSDTLTIGNYGAGWSTGDILTYILITP